MKLLVYSHFFAPSIGGVETIVSSLAKGLAAMRGVDGEKQFDVTVVTQTPAGDFADGSIGFRVVRQPGLAALWSLVSACDVIHVAGPALAPLFFCWLAGKPVVVEHHGYQASCPNGLLLHQPDRTICPGHYQARRYSECLRCQASENSKGGSWAGLLRMFPRRFLVRRAAANIAVTRHVQERQGLPHSLVILHGVEDPLGNEAVSPPSSGEAVKICFGYAGRFVREKGISSLVEAARLLKKENLQFEVRLIGDGAERQSLEEQIATYELESCVRITGFLTGTALAEAVRDVRVMVMPSVCEETAGLAAIEQMMVGRLVIASGIGGLAEVVRDAGLTCPPGDAEALAECMKKVISEPSLVDRYGEKARARAVQYFALRRMIEEHAAVYQEAVRKMKG